MAKQKKTWKMFNACTNPQRKWALWIESSTASNWYTLQMDKDQVLALRISPYIMNLLHQFYEICPISSNKSQHLNNLPSDPPCLGSSVRTCLPIVGIQWVLPSFLNLNLSSKMPKCSWFGILMEEWWAEKNIIHSCTFPTCKCLFHTFSELKVIYLEPLTFLEDLTPNHTVEGQLTRYLLVCSESSFCQLGSSTKCRGKINYTPKSQHNGAFGNNDFPFHPRGKYCEVPAAIGGSCWSSGNKTLRTLHYTDWFREILLLGYYNPYIGG